MLVRYLQNVPNLFLRNKSTYVSCFCTDINLLSCSISPWDICDVRSVFCFSIIPINHNIYLKQLLQKVPNNHVVKKIPAAYIFPHKLALHDVHICFTLMPSQILYPFVLQNRKLKDKHSNNANFQNSRSYPLYKQKATAMTNIYFNKYLYVRFCLPSLLPQSNCSIFN